MKERAREEEKETEGAGGEKDGVTEQQSDRKIEGQKRNRRGIEG